MTKLNRNTKKAQSFIQAYKNAPLYRDLKDCYNNYSYEKARVYRYCLDLVEQYSGYDYTITGYNCMVFSFAFLFDDENGHNFLCYITRCNDYIIQLD